MTIRVDGAVGQYPVPPAMPPAAVLHLLAGEAVDRAAEQAEQSDEGEHAGDHAVEHEEGEGCGHGVGREERPDPA